MKMQFAVINNETSVVVYVAMYDTIMAQMAL